MDVISCITCQTPMRDHVKFTPDFQWAVCTICGARYEVIAAMDEAGHPQYAPDGHQMFYLNPVAPGRPQFHKETDELAPVGDQNDVTVDMENTKTVIQNTDTVEDFLNALKKL